MKYFLLYISLLVAIEGFAQTKLKYSGTFGDTSRIEMEITSSNEKDYSGRYRIENTREWILLKGAMYYDRRNKIPQNLVLHQFGSEKDTAVFDLYMEGSMLTGTWQQSPDLPIKEVKLELGGLNKSNAFDGFYSEGNNELSVSTISASTIEISIWVKERKGCSEMKLKGNLLKVGEQWKGSMPDVADKGEVALILSFDENRAKVEIIPAFLPGAECEIKQAVYVKQVAPRSN